MSFRHAKHVSFVILLLYKKYDKEIEIKSPQAFF